MNRLIGPLLGLSLLLTACPGPNLPAVPVALTDPNVPSGSWAGQLVQRRDPRVVAEARGQIYLHDGYLLESVDVQTGEQLHAVDLPVNWGLAYRADGVILVLGERALLAYDAGTLTGRPSVPLPMTQTQNGSAQLSADGRVLTYNLGSAAGPLHYSTVTGKALPVPRGDTLLGTTGDEGWWLLARRDTQGLTYRVTDTASGAGFSVPVPPDPACPDAGSAAVVTFRRPEVASTADPVRVLVFRPDGQVEVRGADGGVLRTERFAPACTSVAAVPFPQPGLVRVRSFTATSEVASVIDAETGLVQHSATSVQTSTARQHVAVVSSGVVTTTVPVLPDADHDQTRDAYWLPENLPTVSHRPWSGAGWTLPNEVMPVSLNLAVQRTDAQSAIVTGDGTLSGAPRRLTGQLTAFQSTLTAQGTPFTPSLSVRLDVLDGTTADGTLSMFTRLPLTSVQPPASVDPGRRPGYVTSLAQTGRPRLQGILRRP